MSLLGLPLQKPNKSRREGLSRPEPNLPSRSRLSIVYSLGTALIFFVFLAAPSAAQPRKGDRSRLTLVEIPLPKNVLLIADEGIAFEARGEASRGQVRVPLHKLRERLPAFQQVLVFETSQGGTSGQAYDVGNRSWLTLSAHQGHRYLVVANLGPRYSNSYLLMCKLKDHPKTRVYVPKICTLILCDPLALTARDLLNKVPQISAYADELKVGQELVGGFDSGHQTPCEKCFSQYEPFFPVLECTFGDPDYDAGAPDSLPCEFAGWGSATASSCPLPKTEEGRSWSRWTEFYDFTAGDDLAVLTINLGSEIPCAGFGVTLDVVATYDQCTVIPRYLQVRGVHDPVEAYWDQSPDQHSAAEYEDVYLAFKSTTAFDNGDYGPRRHRLWIKWSLPWLCSHCPSGELLPLVGNVRDSRREDLVSIRKCQSSEEDASDDQPEIPATSREE